MKEVKAGSKFNNTINDIFKKKIEQLTFLNNKYFPGSMTVAYKGKNLSVFSQLTHEEKLRVVEDTSKYLDIYITLERENFDLRSEQQFLWRVLQMSGLRLGSNCMEMIGEDEIVEMYSLEGIHLWYNLRYMQICSHTVEQIRCMPWNDRYIRQPSIDQSCYEFIEKTLLLEKPDILTSTVPVHVVDEVDSMRLYSIEVDFKNIAPVYKVGTDEKAGFIVTSKCKKIKARRSFEDFEKLQRQIANRNGAHLSLVPPSNN